MPTCSFAAFGAAATSWCPRRSNAVGLFWKIFVAFMIAMTVTSVGAIYVTFQLANAPLTLTDFDGRDKIIREMSGALARGGEYGLKSWLFDNPRPAPGTVVLVTNERGDELLGRAMPRELRALLRFRPGGRRPDVPPNLRPMQVTPTLIGPDASEYNFTFARAPVTIFGILMWPGTQVAVLTIAILAAAIMSVLLARYLSSPIVQLQKA